MESTFNFRSPSSLSHHHHHHHHHCHRHHHHHHHHQHHLCRYLALCTNKLHHHHCNFHFLACPRFAPVPLQVADPNATPTPHNDLQFNTYNESYFSDTQVLQDPEINELEDEQEEDDDPVFVLTDEWKEFFAKSEAKRKLEKRQARKKDKH